MKKIYKDINTYRFDLGPIPFTAGKLYLECLSVGLAGKTILKISSILASALNAHQYESQWLEIEETNESI